MFLLAGCSFVNSPDCHLTLFGPDSQDFNKSRIVSRGGAGNRYIAHSIINNIDLLNVDKVFVLWSGMSRIDIPLPRSVASEFASYSHKNLEDDCLWVHTGGWGGLWTDETNYPSWAKQYAKTIYFSQDWDFIVNQNLIQIAGCLGLLESKKIPYKWGFIYDIHTEYFNEASLGPAVKKDNHILKSLPKHTQIELSPYEFCRDAGLLDPSDHFHPTKQGWEEWKNAVSSQLVF
jgi:hypothetical protein